MTLPLNSADRLIGREAELEWLLERWRVAAAGTPQLVVISGMTGRGKTRLAQEFYRRLAETQPPAQRYWPPSLTGSRSAMNLVPDPGSETNTGPPWLWLAMRCGDRAARNSLAPTDFPLDALRSQVRCHLAGFYRSVQQRERRSQHAKAALSVLASFAFPGAGGAIEVGGQLLGAMESGVDAADAVRLLRQRLAERRQGRADDLSPSATHAVDDLLDALKAVCTQVKAPDGSRLPVALIWDDAHWSDPDLAVGVQRILERAVDREWPLMIVTTCWPEGVDREATPARPLRRLLSWTEQEAERRGTQYAFQLALAPLPRTQADEFVRQRLPMLEAPARRLLIERSGGDLDLLGDYCTELAHGVGWLDSDGRLAVEAERLSSLPSGKLEMARRLLRSAGREVGEVLAMGSVQGPRFFGAFLAAMASEHRTGEELMRLLAAADRPLGLCEVRPHAALTADAEFRTRLLFEVCREAFDRLPGRAALLRALAEELRRISRSGALDELPSVERLAVLEDVMFVADELDLWSEPEWPPTLLSVGLEVARLELALGHLERARTTAESVRAHATPNSDTDQCALDILCQHAHVTGAGEREEALLGEWRSIPSADRSAAAAIRAGRREVRVGRPDEAVATLEAAMLEHGQDEVRLQIELARAYCYSGEAPRALAQLDGLSDHRPDWPTSLQTAYDHARYMALHDLDLNRAAAALSDACVERFRRAGALEEELLCLVNLGDARWGAGEVHEAAQVLEVAADRAEEAELPHARNLARLCLANVRAEDAPERALLLYEVALRDAEASGWAWDAIYGRVYKSLLICELSGSGGAVLRLHAEEAQRRGYLHLAHLAYGLSTVADVKSGRGPDSSTVDVCLASPFPAAQVHAAAAVVLGGESDHPNAADALTRAVARGEGIKGRQSFIDQALGQQAAAWPAAGQGLEPR